MSRSAHPTYESLIDFLSVYGAAYLSSGGPTSRLESQITRIGSRFGFRTHVFATPTGIFISCVSSAHREQMRGAQIFRIRENSIDLGKLCDLEALLQAVEQHQVSLAQATKMLESARYIRHRYPLPLLFAAAFIAGTALSMPAYGNGRAALVSGAIATLTWWVTGAALRKRVPSPMFRDFLGGILTLLLAALAQIQWGGAAESYAVGGLVVLVPGLALTNAISELAEQNLISGTAKLMQALLTLLALGLAYVLSQELAQILNWRLAVPEVHRPLSWLAAGAGVLTSVAAFGVLFHVPPRALPWASLIGLLAWVILRKWAPSQYFFSATFLASLCVGGLSLGLGRIFSIPSQIFSVPGIIAMLPGMLALRSFRSLSLGGSGAQVGSSGGATEVLIVAGCIVFGLFTARIFSKILTKSSEEAESWGL